MKRVLRIVGIGVGIVVGLLVLAVGGIALNAQRQQGQRFDNPAQELTVEVTPERVARGQYLATAFPGCAGCHSSNALAHPPVLDGNLMADLAPLGTFYAPNLTPGGPLKDWTDGDIVRAIREGVSKDGRGLAIMPSAEFRHLSDEDVGALVAFLRSQPAVEKTTPIPSLSFLGTMLLGSGQVGLSRQEPVRNVTAPPRGPSVEYGKHLADVSGCSSCHGPALDGQNVPPGPPPGPTLRLVKGWTAEQFIQTMRTGVDPGGHQLGEGMPWRQYGQGTDEDLTALHAYLNSLP